MVQFLYAPTTAGMEDQLLHHAQALQEAIVRRDAALAEMAQATPDSRAWNKALRKHDAADLEAARIQCEQGPSQLNEVLGRARRARATQQWVQAARLFRAVAESFKPNYHQKPTAFEDGVWRDAQLCAGMATLRLRSLGRIVL